MNIDLLAIALLAGAANWAFRVLPIRMRPKDLPLDGRLTRFLAATGPAAIGTLFVASILPAFSAPLLPLILGTLTVVAVFALRRSVVTATLAGAIVHGLTVAITG